MGTIEKDGTVSIGPLVKIDTSPGLPSELCWLAVSPDDRFVIATNFGYSYVSSFHIDGNKLVIAKDPACPKVPGDGTARGLCGDVTSGPADNWITPDGANVIVLPLLLGLGVSGAIHVVMRWRGEAESEEVAATSTPRAVMFSALTTIASFGSLALSSHRGLASMGLLLTIAILRSLVCTLVVLPGMLTLAHGRSPESDVA